MAVVTTSYQTHPFPLILSEPELPPPPAVAVTPCDPWPRPYYLENGLRRVAPYHFTYNTYCKQRWRGREILDIFAAEFRDRSREYYKDAIEQGKIVINGKPCRDIHTIVKNGDVVSHTLHRHEPPVTAQPIRVISETDDMIVIDKPAGVPVHPAGRYNYNSIVEIMRAERHFSFNPLPCNRLDRLTSGVMFVGKTSKEAEAISQKLRGRTVRKEYVARVKGRFPDGEGWDGNPMRGGVVRCDESILQISPILGLNRARASGKRASTLFRRIAYYPPKPTGTGSPTRSTSSAISDDSLLPDGSTAAPPAPPLPTSEDEGYSIVHCLPLTGRTHQIRVHLQFLGHPISNDPIYSNRRVFGPELAQADASPDHDAEIIQRLSRMGKEEVADAYDYSARSADQPPRQPTYTQRGPYKPLNSGTLHAGSLEPTPSSPTSGAKSGDYLTTSPPRPSSVDPDGTYATLVRAHDEMVADYNRRKGEKMTGEMCPVCDTPLYSDPGPQELGIYLHALAYSDANGAWSYRSRVPEWGMPPSPVGRRVEDRNENGEVTVAKEVRMHGPTEVEAWVYDGTEVWELDEEDDRRKRDRQGMERNRELET